MNNSESLYRSFIWQHRLIGFFRNIDLPGFRKLSLLLPKWLLPDPKDIGEHLLRLPSGLKLFIDPVKDQGVERSLFETGSYERGTLHFISTHLKEGDTFVDVGANIGLMSLTAKEKVGSEGKVWAFEANPITFDILEKNMAENDMEEIHAFCCGMGAKREEQLLYDNWSINRGAASTVVKGENAQEIKIQILPLDEVVSNQGIFVDMIKIDVEGMELEVLQGAHNTISKDRPILIVEFSIERSAANTRHELFIHLQSLGIYKFYKLSGGKERVSKMVELQSYSELPIDDNVFCIPQIN